MQPGLRITSRFSLEHWRSSSLITQVTWQVESVTQVKPCVSEEASSWPLSLGSLLNPQPHFSYREGI